MDSNRATFVVRREEIGGIAKKIAWQGRWMPAIIAQEAARQARWMSAGIAQEITW